MVHWEQISKRRAKRRKQLIILWTPAVLISLAALAATPWLLGPRCPDRIVIATGNPNGAYFAFANQYRDILATKGIELEVRSTAGSVENDELLRSDQDVSLAIIQGGAAEHQANVAVESLASLYQEPVWVFCRSEKPIDSLLHLRGKRIAVGPDGSGTRSIALNLLSDNDVPDDPMTRLFDYGVTESIEKLKLNQIDAAFIVISPTSPLVRDLLKTRGIRLLSFRRAAAYQKKYPFLSSATLPEGLIDFENNIPDQDIQLLAPTANLVARKDLHHALIPLILQAVEEVHEKDGMLVHAATFPTPKFTDYHLNKDARRYFQSGPSLLYRFLPFWLAAWLDRVKLIILPMCTLLIPLLKVAPPVYRWRIRSKIYRWYRDLHDIDMEMKDVDQNLDVVACIKSLKEIEQELFEVTVPLSYMEEFYNLRSHVSFVLDNLEKLEKAENYPRVAA